MDNGERKKGVFYMISSSEHKLCLSGWLMKNDAKNYNIPLKLQKFLLLYESFSKVDGEKYDFSGLKGYKRGPVFSSVWGDYTKERAAFDEAAANAYMSNAGSVNEDIAFQSSFVVGALSEDELSDLTHKMNIWSCKEDRIINGEFQVELSGEDFNSNDYRIMDMLAKMFPLQMIKNSSIIDIDDHYFVLDKKDANSLSNEQIKTLHMLCEKEELHNPIYVSIDERGRLVID